MTAYISKCGFCHTVQFTQWYSKRAPHDRYGRVDRDYLDSNPIAYCSEEHRDAADAQFDAHRAEVLGSDPEVQRLRALLAERPVNEALVKAREAAAAMFEVEAGERRPLWRIIITDSESPTGIAPVCTAEGVNDLHLWANFGNGIERVADGVWDCCPSPQFDTYSTVLAAYLVELLNSDAEAGEPS